ncbi:hypothetical protein [Afipia sp. GAS231]|uniref:hypothetical protein n=1 Tax=Afipia sp. GAS231 TaxID=1882747 RepID=UPI00087C9E67|nr:hypothetical protein [Afipia sp. GAS231]SDN38117.1 hypothetical protein SAMN05444050_1423 [Afipia sp. GAS231]
MLDLIYLPPKIQNRVRASALRVGIAAALLSPLLAVAGGELDDALPPTLRDTGLYQDWDTKTIGPDKLAYSPQYPLWSDGAIKSRWMQLPPGAFVDASQPDAWQFPIGTKFWKEFKFSRRAETRYIERTAQGWKYATYVWNDDETQAVLAPKQGIRNSVPINDKVRHGIPSRSDCHSCHEGNPVPILGFGALQLSVDRDPNAPHSEPLPDGDVTLLTLIKNGQVRGLPSYLTNGDPRIAARSPTARAALGYLHGNCGGCHTFSGELGNLDFSLKYPVTLPPPDRPPALDTTLGHISKFVPPSWETPGQRVRAGDADHSVLAERIASRNPYIQMPPLGTRLVDDEAVTLIRKWISEEPQSKDEPPK